MPTDYLSVLNRIRPGRTSAYNEAKDPAYASAVFVESENRDLMLSPDEDILLLVGGKGSGKTTLYLHLESNPPSQVGRADDSPMGLACAFVNAARAHCRQAVDAFRTLASEVHDHAQKHKIAVGEAFKAIHPVQVDRNWLHILAYEALKAIGPILARQEKPTVPEGLQVRLKDYVVVYGLADSTKLVDVAAKWISRHVISRELKLNFTIPYVGANVQFEKSELDPWEVFSDIDAVMRCLNLRLYVVVDTLDELLGRRFEEVRLCLLGSFMDLAVNWDENFPNISLKLLMRADYAMRAEYDHMDRIVDRYAVLRWTKEQFLRLVLKRLLYSEAVRKAVEFDGDVTKIDGMFSVQLEAWFALFFGVSLFELRAETLAESDSLLSDTCDLKVAPHDYLYRYFLDGKQSIPLRHVVSFLRCCKKREQKRRMGIPHDGGTVTAETPLFDRSTLEKVLNEDLPALVLKQIDREYPFVRSIFSKLASSLCGRRFGKDEILKHLAEIEPTPPETAESVFRSLFYSGLVGGEGQLEDHCKHFYFPVFIHFALMRGYSEKDSVTTE